MWESLKFLASKYTKANTFFLPAYFYAETTLDSYCMMREHLFHMYPTYCKSNTALEEPYRLLKSIYLGHPSINNLPRYPVTKKTEQAKLSGIMNKKENKDVQFFREVNPGASEGDAYPIVVSMHPITFLLSALHLFVFAYFLKPFLYLENKFFNSRNQFFEPYPDLKNPKESHHECVLVKKS